MGFFRLHMLAALLFLLEVPGFDAKATKEVIPILNRANQFSTLIKLLEETNLLQALENQLNTSVEGITAFAPTDAAFRKLPTGTIENLNSIQQTLLLYNHAVPRYYTFDSLAEVTFPLYTFYGPLNIITLRQKRPFVSIGTVTTAVKNPLSEKFPLSVFPIDDVLLSPFLLG